MTWFGNPPKSVLMDWAHEYYGIGQYRPTTSHIINTIDLTRRPMLLKEITMNTETPTPELRELTPEELAMLAMAPKDEAFEAEMFVTTDEETAEEAAPTLH